MKKNWKIGTRGSLLALTQCGQIKNLLETQTGHTFELVIIKTRGDQQTDVPLWQLEGKDFFTRELDIALLQNEVDLVVHSYKDLGSERPQGITLAAITERRFGHDILLMPKKNVDLLQAGAIKTLIVGTSSPRRIENITNGLPALLPGRPEVETKMLRGNVNTRIQKLRDGEFHAIVLAMPGLERLAQDDKARVELSELLRGMDFMILPASRFPWAASQGALALEMHAHHPHAQELADLLKSVHHEATAQAVARERKAFNSYGGGCHLAVGVAVAQVQNKFFVHSHRGKRDQQTVEQLYLEPAPAPFKNAVTFVGMPDEDQLLLKTVRPEVQVDCRAKDVYVTSHYVMASMQNATEATGLWAAGTKTWEKLAAKNLWVHGASDSLGENQLKAFMQSALLKLMREREFSWLILSGDDAHSTLGPVVATYQRQCQEIDGAFEQKIEQTSDFFWTSYAQYQAYTQRIPSVVHKRHWCGLGKTYEAFCANGTHVIAVSGINEFRSLTEGK